MKAHAYKNIVSQKVDLVFEHDGAVGLPLAVTMKKTEPDELVQPTLSLPYALCQSLMQELWDIGFRPNNGAGSTAEVEAMRKHIAFAESVTSKLLEWVK